MIFLKRDLCHSVGGGLNPQGVIQMSSVRWQYLLQLLLTATKYLNDYLVVASASYSRIRSCLLECNCFCRRNSSSISTHFLCMTFRAGRVKSAAVASTGSSRSYTTKRYSIFFEGEKTKVLESLRYYTPIMIRYSTP